MADKKIQVAIVDFGLGNLFSVQQACRYAGMDARMTSSSADLFAADAVILPGVGAYGDAMAALRKLDLVLPLQEIGASDKWMIGICLGLQLLMTESYEFGRHQGLGIFDGVVIPLETQENADIPKKLKVPQVGWNQIWGDRDPGILRADSPASWASTPLLGIHQGEYMYFVHSFYIKPANPEHILSTTQYGQIEFCSSLQYNNTFACQFHPERSGRQGLRVYENIAATVKKSLE